MHWRWKRCRERDILSYEMLSDETHPYCNSEQSRASQRPKKFYFDLAPSDSKAGFPVLFLSPPRNSSVLLITHWGWANRQLSPLTRWVLKPAHCLLRNVQEIHMIRRLLNLYHNSTVYDMTAVWDQLGLTVYSTVDFSVAMMVLDHLIFWHTIIL